jgi:dual specificity phosphatase 12
MQYQEYPRDPANEILPGLWLGNRVAALDPVFLREKHIKAVFNCTKDIPFEATVQRRYRVPVDDNLQEEEIRNLELWSFELVYKLAAELRRTRADGDAVLVHCAAGMQRSAATVGMYLIATQNLKTEDCIKVIQAKRPIAFRPAANFEKAMRGFEAAFAKEIRPHLQG